MREPFKVAVVGPGGLGSCSIRELSRLPETRLVGVLAYSPQKNGADAGELAGIGTLGVKATTSFDEFVKIDCDCVLYTARDFGDFRADKEILALLESGRNVVTPLPYHFLKARGEEVQARFEAAARKGGSTLHGTGITPGFFNERLAMTMTGLSNDIQQISMQEFFNAELLADSLQTLQLLGFGSPKEAVANNPVMGSFAENYLKQPILYAAEKLGIKVERIERTSQVRTAPAAIKTPHMTIETGTVALVSYAWTAYTDTGKPFYRTEVFWYMGEAMKPKEATANDFWTVAIEGRPSIRVSVEGMGSLAKHLVIDATRDPAPAGYIMTVVAMVQAIPRVVAAPPGLMLPAMPEVHWKPDMRLT